MRTGDRAARQRLMAPAADVEWRWRSPHCATFAADPRCGPAWAAVGPRATSTWPAVCASNAARAASRGGRASGP